jgi:hypothetical protein
MERTKTNRALHALTLILLSALFYCCADEHDGFNVPTGGAEKTVTFSVKVPGNSTPKNYALETADENEVKQIAVLLFTDGKYIYQPIYNNTITSTGDGTAKTFTLKVPKGTYDMVILANANASLKSVISNIQEGNSKSSVLEKITLTNTEKWNTDTNSGTYVPIPMWAEIRDITVTDGMNAVSASLLRMVAKIDVNLGPDAQKKFSLTSVRLYNYNTKGLIAPNTETDKDGNVTAKISVLGEPTKGPLLYTGDDIQKDKTTSKGISCANEIYTFEAKAGTAENLGNNTCLVIGGLYDNDKTETFYRVDFANTDAAAATYLALLRNYQYKVNIQEITGQGLATEDLAFASRPVNIKASILKWDDGKFTQFAVDGQYMIGLSQGEFIFSREERDDNSGDNTLSVITDTPGGWSLQITDTEGKELPDDNKWLTTNVTESTNPKTGDDIKLRLKPNETGSSRTAIVHVKAGRLDYKVKVTQLNTLNIGIHIIAGDKEVSSLTFVSTEQECIDKKQPAAQSFAVRWAPTSSSVSSFTTNPSGTDKAFAFDTKSGNKDLSKEVTLTASPTGYTIQPQLIAPGTIANDPFYTRSSIVLYTVSDGITSAYKALTLKQSVYNAKPVVANTYLMDGGTKTFGVRSNCRFVAKIVENPSNVIVSGLSYKGDVPTIEGDGVPVSFKLVDDLTNPTLYQKFVKIEISSPDNLFNTKTIELNCVSGLIQDESNTYIVKPNGTGLLIPVARANKSDLGPNQIGANDAFTAELVWTDNSKGVASDSNIKIVKAAGKGDTGYVLVLPGSAQGNAVVAAKVGGNIIWSWHIWVSKEEPTAIGIFMDRSLGALGTTPGSADAVGLNYQWGRKDPLPKIFTVGDKGKSQAIYDSNGKSISFAITEPQSLKDVISHPLYHPIAKVNVTTDWCSTSNNLFWNPDKKTIYDPCPKGWRIAKTKTLNGEDGYQANWDKDGVMIQKQGGWYAGSGWYESDAKIGNTPHGAACVWSSSYAPKEDRKMAFYFSVTMNGGGIGVENPMYRSTAMQVRCINK